MTPTAMRPFPYSSHQIARQIIPEAFRLVHATPDNVTQAMPCANLTKDRELPMDAVVSPYAGGAGGAKREVTAAGGWGDLN